MPEPIKILELTGITVGGSAEHVLLLASRLPSDEFDVHLAFSGGGPLDDEFRETGLDVLDYAPSHGEGSFTQGSPDGAVELFRQFMRIRRLIANNDFDIVHTHTSVAGAMGRIAAVTCRHRPLRLHMLHAYASHDEVPQPKRAAFRLFEMAIDKITNNYVAGSEFIKRVGTKRHIFKPSKTTVIHYSSDSEIRPGRVEERRQVLESMGVPDAARVVALVGRVEDQKGVDNLVAVAPTVLQQVSDAHFVIVGDGSLTPGLREMADQLGVADRIHFVGWRSDIPEIMRSIDILAIPSRWEAFGIVNLEAMAASKPVVGFAVEGIPEVVEHGVTGLLSEPGDRDAFARDLVSVLLDDGLADRLGTAGARRFAEMFATDKMVSAHIELFRRLIPR